VEKQGLFDWLYSDADGLPDGNEYPAEAHVLSFVEE